MRVLKAVNTIQHQEMANLIDARNWERVKEQLYQLSDEMAMKASDVLKELRHNLEQKAERDAKHIEDSNEADRSENDVAESASDSATEKSLSDNDWVILRKLKRQLKLKRKRKRARKNRKARKTKAKASAPELDKNKKKKRRRRRRSKSRKPDNAMTNEQVTPTAVAMMASSQMQCAWLIEQLARGNTTTTNELAKTILAPAEQYRPELVLMAGSTVGEDWEGMRVQSQSLSNEDAERLHERLKHLQSTMALRQENRKKPKKVKQKRKRKKKSKPKSRHTCKSPDDRNQPTDDSSDEDGQPRRRENERIVNRSEKPVGKGHGSNKKENASAETSEKSESHAPTDKEYTTGQHGENGPGTKMAHRKNAENPYKEIAESNLKTMNERELLERAARAEKENKSNLARILNGEVRRRCERKEMRKERKENVTLEQQEKHLGLTVEETNANHDTNEVDKTPERSGYEEIPHTHEKHPQPARDTRDTSNHDEYNGFDPTKSHTRLSPIQAQCFKRITWAMRMQEEHKWSRSELWGIIAREVHDPLYRLIIKASDRHSEENTDWLLQLTKEM
jgi:hypothetical protein